LQVQKAKQGYKKVKYIFQHWLEIPDDWDFKRVKQECEKLVVGFVGTCDPFYTNEDGVPMLRTTNVSEGRLKLSNLKYVTKEFHEKNKKSQVKENDLLVSRHGENGEACLVHGLKEANCLNIVIIRSKKDLFDPEFFEFAFNSSIVRKQIRRTTAGGVQGVVNTSEIGKVKIVIPPINEQQQIASILSNVDNLIKSYDKVIESTKKLKKGLMQQLLTKGIGHTKFKKVKTSFGKYEKNPENWNYETIESLNQHVTYGLTIRPQYVEEGIPLISAKEIGSGNIDYDIASKISKLDYEKLYEKSKGQKDDVLISKTGTIGLVGRAKTDQIFAITQNVASLRPIKKLILPKFLEWSLRTYSFYRKCFRTLNATTILDLQLGELKKIRVPLPTIQEQQKIVSILSEVDSRISHLEQNELRFKSLKKGLMQKLLTGQIRVKI